MSNKWLRDFYEGGDEHDRLLMQEKRRKLKRDKEKRPRRERDAGLRRHRPDRAPEEES
jgi:hypothetical protein